MVSMVNTTSAAVTARPSEKRAGLSTISQCSSSTGRTDAASSILGSTLWSSTDTSGANKRRATLKSYELIAKRGSGLSGGASVSTTSSSDGTRAGLQLANHRQTGRQ